MGLDMYLYRKTYVDSYGDNKRYDISIEPKTEKGRNFDTSKITYITEEIAYWRKQNAIHKFFVDECGGGVDECQPIYVDISKLQELVDRCHKILNDKDNIVTKEEVFKDWNGEDRIEVVKYLKDPTLANELLPTQSGFFFGSTSYDDWYLLGLQNTIDAIEPILKDEKNQNTDTSFYYEASW